MRITVRYIDKLLNKKLEINFNGFEWFGSWYANSYEYVKVIEVIQEE